MRACCAATILPISEFCLASGGTVPLDGIQTQRAGLTDVQQLLHLSHGLIPHLFTRDGSVARKSRIEYDSSKFVYCSRSFTCPAHYMQSMRT